MGEENAMRRISVLGAALIVSVATLAPGIEAAALERMPIGRPQERGRITPRRGPVQHAPVQLHRGFPIQRPPRPVFVIRPEVRVRITPRIFLPPVFFGGVIIDQRPYVDPGYYPDRRRYYDDRYRNRYYDRNRLSWYDSELLYGQDGWAEFTLECNAYGQKLWFEVRDGRLRVDWAEVVFETGEAQVVDFSERSLGPGVYPLLDLRGGRRIDHVRMVAEATTRQAEVILRLEQ